MAHPKYTPKQIARYRSKVGQPVPPRGCCLWTAGKFKNGYGAFWVNGQNHRAHRVAWEIANGPIPDGLGVLHQCDTPACQNVNHLFLGTNIDNTADKVAKGRQAKGPGAGPKNPPCGDQHYARLHPELLARGDRNGARKRPERLAWGDRNGARKYPERLRRGEASSATHLTDSQVTEIRNALATRKESQRALARRFRVSQGTISLIGLGKTWRHLL